MNEKLKSYAALIPFLKRTLSSSFEIVLFDTLEAGLPVVAHSSKDQENIRAARRLLAEVLGDAQTQDMICNRAILSDEEAILKCSIYFIKSDFEAGKQDDSDGCNEIIGALCIIMRCNTYLKLKSILDDLMQFDAPELSVKTGESAAEEDVITEEEPSLAMVDRIVAESGVAPERMTQDERIEIMCLLYEKGIFSLKGAVAKVADSLAMSEQSIYRYLSKIRKMRA